MTEQFAGFRMSSVHGVPVLARPDARFKTFRVSLCLRRPLAGPAAARALLPSLLVEGTAVHPDRPSVVRALDRLYGAHVSPGTGRFGESVVLRLAADAVAGAFLPGRPDQWQGALDLLTEFALRPRLLDGAFPAEVFTREQKQALDAARAVADDKGPWARQRAVELGCQGEAYGVPDHGGEAAIAALTAADPEAARRDFLERGARWVVAMGALPEELDAAIAPLLAALPAGTGEPLPPPVVPPRRPARATVEHAALQQGKQVLLLRCPVPATVAELCALQVAVNLWGGGPHSRLFREVREKRSLAYYASASADVHKGLVLVQIGLDAAAAGQARDEAMRQLAAVAAGEFTDQELATAIATIVGPLASVDDTLAGRMQFCAEGWLRGFDQTPEQRIASYRAVTREAVAAQAGALWLDHDYLLCPPGGAA